MYEVADLHYLFEDLVLCLGDYRNNSIWNIVPASVQTIPLLA